MPKTEQNIRESEEFIRHVLSKTFHQDVKPEELRSAAEKLCEALPSRKKEVA